MDQILEWLTYNQLKTSVESDLEKNDQSIALVRMRIEFMRNKLLMKNLNNFLPEN